MTSADLMLKNKVPWYRTPVPRDEMAKLLERSDLKGFAQAGGHVALCIATGALFWYATLHWPWYVSFLLLMLHGTVTSFLLAGFHELSHQTVFKTRWLNAFFLHLVSWVSWASPVWYWTSHQEHHKYTLHPPDDLEVTLPYDLTLKSFLRSVLINPLDVWFRVRGLVNNALGHVRAGPWGEHLFPATAGPLRRRLRNWARWALLGHAAVIVLALVTGWWQLILLVTFGSYFSNWVIYLAANPQHAGLQDSVPDFRLCTRTYTVNPVVQFLYWHMNYHLDHHMYAAVPCYNLGKLHRLIQHDLPPCHHGLIATWREIITIVRRQKLEPGYQYVAPLPAPRAAAQPAGAD